MKSLFDLIFLINVFLKRGLPGVSCFFFFGRVKFLTVASAKGSDNCGWCRLVAALTLQCPAALAKMLQRNNYCLRAQPRQQRAKRGMKRRDSQRGRSSTCDVPRTQPCFPRGRRPGSVAAAVLEAGRAKPAPRYCLSRGSSSCQTLWAVTPSTGSVLLSKNKKKPHIVF